MVIILMGARGVPSMHRHPPRILILGIQQPSRCSQEGRGRRCSCPPAAAGSPWRWPLLQLRPYWPVQTQLARRG
jgi:hypothetical protein